MPGLLIFFTPLIVFIIDAVKFVFCCKRLHPAIRLPFELIITLLYPYLFITLILGGSFLFTETFEITRLLISILSIGVLITCIAAYFISCYKKRLLSPKKEATLNFILFIGILINIAMVIILSSGITWLGLLGNVPLIIAYGVALINNISIEKDRREIENMNIIL